MSETYVTIDGSCLNGRYYRLTTVPSVGDKFEDNCQVVVVIGRTVTAHNTVIIKCKDYK